MLSLGTTGQRAHRISLYYFLELYVNLQLPKSKFKQI